MRIPTEEDWGTLDPNDLDAAYAHRVFFGKSVAEAELLFRHDVLERAEDLQFMPAIPFQYYVLAFRDFVRSEEALKDECDAADAANSFLRLLESRLEADRASVIPVLEELLPAVDAVAREQSRYSAAVEIYGDFGILAANIQSLAGRRTRG